jgi:DNA polymerase epsilon subunit 2
MSIASRPRYYSRQIILRNENFTPPALGGHDRANYLKLTSTRNLLGRAGQLFLLFGMLSRDPEGRLCLEDGEGRVRLDMTDAVSFRVHIEA